MLFASLSLTLAFIAIAEHDLHISRGNEIILAYVQGPNENINAKPHSRFNLSGYTTHPVLFFNCMAHMLENSMQALLGLHTYMYATYSVVISAQDWFARDTSVAFGFQR